MNKTTIDYTTLTKLAGAGADGEVTKKKMHEAAAYDTWFKAEIAKSIQEADDPNAQWVSSKDVNKQFSTKRDAMRQRIKAG